MSSISCRQVGQFSLHRYMLCAVVKGLCCVQYGLLHFIFRENDDWKSEYSPPMSVKCVLLQIDQVYIFKPKANKWMKTFLQKKPDFIFYVDSIHPIASIL